MTPWTTAEELILTTGVADRALASSIGSALGRSKNSILGKARKMGLSWDLSSQEVSHRNSANAQVGREIARSTPQVPYYYGQHIPGFDDWSAYTLFSPTGKKRF